MKVLDLQELYAGCRTGTTGYQVAARDHRRWNTDGRADDGAGHRRRAADSAARRRHRCPGTAAARRAAAWVVVGPAGRAGWGICGPVGAPDDGAGVRPALRDSRRPAPESGGAAGLRWSRSPVGHAPALPRTLRDTLRFTACC